MTWWYTVMSLRSRSTSINRSTSETYSIRSFRCDTRLEEMAAIIPSGKPRVISAMSSLPSGDVGWHRARWAETFSGI